MNNLLYKFTLWLEDHETVIERWMIFAAIVVLSAIAFWFLNGGSFMLQQ